jgi:hypothetical protein
MSVARKTFDVSLGGASGHPVQDIVDRVTLRDQLVTREAQNDLASVVNFICCGYALHENAPLFVSICASNYSANASHHNSAASRRAQIGYANENATQGCCAALRLVSEAMQRHVH